MRAPKPLDEYSAFSMVEEFARAPRRHVLYARAPTTCVAVARDATAGAARQRRPRRWPTMPSTVRNDIVR